MSRHCAVLTALPALAWCSPAFADPCEGRLPAKGKNFSGIVRYVGDGDGFCIGPEGHPERWVEIRLADFYTPELLGGRPLDRLLLGANGDAEGGRRWSHDR